MSSETQPGFGQRLGRSLYWILRTTIITLLLLAILVGLALLGFWGYQEVQRSFSGTTVRIEANSREIEALAAQVNGLEVAQMTREAQLAGADRDLAALREEQTAVQDALARQDDLLDALSSQLLATSSSGEAALNDIASLGEAVAALQADLNRTGEELDTLGGAVDRIDGAVTNLGEQTAVLDVSVAALEQAAEADTRTQELREVLALFRVWELITRARLRLAEDNVGLAGDDVETAVRTMDLLVTTSSTETVAQSYKAVQGRLALAFANLPDDPTTAAADLETAWNELDAVLAKRILPEPQLVGTTPEAITPTPTAIPTATPTPTP